MNIIINGYTLRQGLMSCRTDLIKCSAFTKDDTFIELIKEIDDALNCLYNAKKVQLTFID